MKTPFRIMVMSGLITAAVCAVVLGQAEALKTHVASIKASLAQNQQNLKHYQWNETTAVLMNGEEKSRKVYQVHYGPDGTIQKTEVMATPEKHARGVRGHIMEKKKEEMTEEMKRAMEIVKQYVPPDPARIQAAMNSGNASVHMAEPGKKVSLTFRNYQMPGDQLTLEFDPSTRHILGANVATYMDDPKNPVDLVVQFGTLPDGTTHPSQSTLNLKSKNLTVVTTNSNYTKLTE